MTSKTKNIINWVLTGLVAFIFLGSAANKLIGGEEALKMASGIGLDKGSFTVLGIIEIVSVILFIIPRTSVLGSLLLVAYMGGAIATHLTHGQAIGGPIGISVFLWLVLAYKFPELSQKLLNK
jgi:hypothetical protein